VVRASRAVYVEVRCVIAQISLVARFRTDDDGCPPACPASVDLRSDWRARHDPKLSNHDTRSACAAGPAEGDFPFWRALCKIEERLCRRAPRLIVSVMVTRAQKWHHRGVAMKKTARDQEGGTKRRCPAGPFRLCRRKSSGEGKTQNAGEATPSVGASSTRRMVAVEKLDESGGVPPQLRCELGRRLAFAAGFVALAWGAFAIAWLLHGRLSPVLGGISVLVVVASMALALRARTAGASSLTLSGSLYLLFVSLAISVSEVMTLPRLQEAAHGVSWNAVWIAFYPMLVPCSPRRTAVKAFLAASMTPAVLSFGSAFLGAPTPGIWSAAVVVVPVYLAAVLAYLSSRFINLLGLDIKRAQDMGMYELEEMIAEGGMGQVWRARHRLLRRPAAVKLIRPPEGGGTVGRVAIERFKREAMVTASLQSPHTVQLWDFGVADDGAFYYVMELLQGRDLEQLVKEEGPQPAARVAHIMRQVLDSLAEAHARGLVHRDIKPANIVIGQRGLQDDFVRVLDFGLVKPDERTKGAGTQLTQDGQISGTPAYLAPEMVLGEHPVDARADLYALACVAYFLLTGQKVFDAATPMAMAIAHATADPEAPSARLGQPVPQYLERAIMKTLHKQPDDRPGSAAAMLAELEASSDASSEASSAPVAPSAEGLGSVVSLRPGVA